MLPSLFFDMTHLSVVLMYTAVPQDCVMAQSIMSSAEDFKHSKMQLYPQHLVKY